MSKERDIVELLRDHAPGLGHGTCADCYANTMELAADEIERLQAALKQIADAPVSYPNQGLQLIAHRALSDQ
jgi:deferrochelatase/peroxidase EfeB